MICPFVNVFKFIATVSCNSSTNGRKAAGHVGGFLYILYMWNSLNIFLISVWNSLFSDY